MKQTDMIAHTNGRAIKSYFFMLMSMIAAPAVNLSYDIAGYEKRKYGIVNRQLKMCDHIEYKVFFLSLSCSTYMLSSSRSCRSSG